MIRLVAYIVFSLLVTALIAWIVALPGTVTIQAAGYHMEPRLGTAVFLLIALVLVCIAFWAIVRRILEAPNRMARAAKRRSRQLGVEALSDGFIALQAGDLKKARQLALEAQTRLPENAAAQLLEARSELALGELGAAREHYRALISNPKTALAALSGLYEQARVQKRDDIALTFAQKALAFNASSAGGEKIGWARDAIFDDLAAKGDWAGALEMVGSEPGASKAARTEKRHPRAVLHTAIAAAQEPTDPAKALAEAQSALKLDPEFVPAALIAGRIFISRGETRKAQSLLRRIWRATGHPHAAMLFANAQSGASAVERLKRTRDLLGTDPADAAAAMVLARAAIDAYEWKTAQEALAPFIADNPSAGMCALMAEIEEGQNSDQGKARQWMARAMRAPRDPIWVADGITSDEWEPVSPVTGKLDAFEWKRPMASRSAALPHSATPLPPGDPGPPPRPAASLPEALEPQTKPLASPPKGD